MYINDKQRVEMLEAAKPLMRWLAENTHSHAKAEVNSTDVILYEGVVIARLPEAVDQTSLLIDLPTPPGMVWLPNLFGRKPKCSPNWKLFAVRYKSGKELLAITSIGHSFSTPTILFSTPLCRTNIQRIARTPALTQSAFFMNVVRTRQLPFPYKGNATFP